MTEGPGAPRSSLSSAISNLVVRVTRDFTGRGPTQARTYMQEDLIVVVLRDTLTRGELQLVRNGRADHVRTTRRYFQDAMRQEIVSGVEALTGRRVIAFLSDSHFEPDLAVETILLEPRPEEDAPQTGRSDAR